MNGNIKLDDDKLLELQAQVGIYQNHALGYHEGELGVRTRQGWEYYYGNLPEPVQRGSSKWVDRSVWESVNGTLQELVSVFTSGSDAVKFAPTTSTDANAAMAATKMVNKILLRENQGFNVLHDAFKECLVTRNSFIKRYWQDYKEEVEEEFSDLSPEEFDAYIMNLGGEVVEMSSEEDDNGRIFGNIKYEKHVEGVKVEYVPFEQVIVEPTATSLRDANYIAHRVRKTKDELIKMGFPMDVVEELNPASSDITAGVIANARVNNLSPLNVSDVLSVGDKHADKVWLYEHYIRTSCATGRLETLQVFTINSQILEVNRVSEHPFETMSPFPVPGTIWGESVYDITKDIQDLNTSLVRGIIDNVMNANFRRYMAVKGSYDLQSLLNNRPGGVVEVQSPGAVMPMDYHQLPGGITQLLEYTESKKEMRTGVSRVGQGLDPNVFKNDNSTATVNMVMTAAQNRLRMVARNIAQRGMMELMAGIYELVRQNGTKPIVVETANGMTTIDPRTLPPRTEMIVAVAVGDGERRERSAAIQSAMMTFTQVPQLTPFLQQNNAYHMGAQLLESLGLYDVENFMTPLDQIPPPQPNPAEQAQLQLLMEQVKNAQVMTQKLMAEIQNERETLAFEQQKAADEMSMKREESLSKQDESADKVAIETQKIQLAIAKLELEEKELELKRQTMLIEAQMESRQARGIDLGRIQ